VWKGQLRKLNLVEPRGSLMCCKKNPLGGKGEHAPKTGVVGGARAVSTRGAGRWGGGELTTRRKGQFVDGDGCTISVDIPRGTTRRREKAIGKSIEEKGGNTTGRAKTKGEKGETAGGVGNRRRGKKK